MTQPEPAPSLQGHAMFNVLLPRTGLSVEAGITIPADASPEQVQAAVVNAAALVIKAVQVPPQPQARPPAPRPAPDPE